MDPFVQSQKSLVFRRVFQLNVVQDTIWAVKVEWLIHHQLLNPSGSTDRLRFGSGPASGAGYVCFNISVDIGHCGQEVSIGVFEVIL